MKYIKLFEKQKESMSFSPGAGGFINKENFKNHSIGSLTGALKGMPDNRDTAKPGDIAIAIWFDNESWYAFKVEDLQDANYKANEEDGLLGLGFAGSKDLGSADSVYDIGLAFHCIVLK